MRIKILLSLAILYASIASAQTAYDFDHYVPLKCAGSMPADFTTLSQDKYQNDIDRERKTKNRALTKRETDFLLKTNYLIDDLLLSGKVLFGDSVTNYVNRVADQVLATDPALREELRFYCVKSEVPNAFTTDQGMIFITTSLVARLGNEAQLAFVLAHEIAHYRLRHTFNSYLEQEKIFEGEGKYKYSNYDERIKLASSFSQEVEFEADSVGFIILSKSTYNCRASLEALNATTFLDLPFGTTYFSPEFLEKGIFLTPSNLLLYEIDSLIIVDPNEDDLLSSHPNLYRRREKINKYLVGYDDLGKVFFAQPEDQFSIARKICRFEEVRMELATRCYGIAIYNAYVLLSEDSTSHYLQLCMAKGLYGLAKYKNKDKEDDVLVDWAEVSGDQQRCAFFLDRVKSPVFSMIALRYLYDFSKQDSSYMVMAMLQDLARDTRKYHDATVEMQQTAINDYPQKFDVWMQDTTRNKLRDTIWHNLPAEEVRLKKDLDKREFLIGYKNYELLIFSDVINQPDVVALFTKPAKSNSEEQTDKYAGMSSYQRRKAEQQERKHKERTGGISLNIDTLIYVDPVYVKATDRAGMNLSASESEQLDFCNQIRDNARYADLNIELLNPKEFKKMDTEKYNDLAALNDWVIEWLDYNEDVIMVSVETDRALEVTSKYNTTHICYSGVYSYRQKRSNRGGIILYSILCYPILPIGLVYAFTPENHTLFYTMIFDVKTGKEELKQITHLKTKSNNGILNSVMYDIMYQVKADGSDKKRGGRK